MRGLALDVAIATLVFLLLTSIWGGAFGFSQIALALIFGLTYAAIKVAMVIFGKGDQ